MKKLVLPFFIVLGVLDFLYGIAFGDRISLIAGGAIVAISVYIYGKQKVGGARSGTTASKVKKDVGRI